MDRAALLFSIPTLSTWMLVALAATLALFAMPRLTWRRYFRTARCRELAGCTMIVRELVSPHGACATA